MDDLDIINERNRRAHGAAISARRAAGKFVVANYMGLSLVSFDTFDDYETAAQAALNAPVRPSEHRTILLPTT